MDISFNTLTILNKGNLITHFYVQHHQSQNYIASITVVSRISLLKCFLSYDSLFKGTCYGASFLALQFQYIKICKPVFWHLWVKGLIFKVFHLLNSVSSRLSERINYRIKFYTLKLAWCNERYNEKDSLLIY